MIQGESKALVNQGVAGTGAAVIYDANHFNPVAFMQGAMERVQAERKAEQVKRAKATQDLLSNLDVKPEGLYFQGDVLKALKDARGTWATPENISAISDPYHPRHKEWLQTISGVNAVGNAQKQINKMIEADMQAARNPNNAGKIDPDSVARLKEVASMPLADAIKVYQESGGTLLKPAYSASDLAEKVTYKPSGFNIEKKGGQEIMTPEVDEDVLGADMDAVISNPENRETVAALLNRYGDVETLKKEMRRLYKVDKPVIRSAAKPSKGSSKGSSERETTSGYANEYFQVEGAFDPNVDFDKDNEANVFSVAYKGGKTAPAFAYTKYDEKTGAASDINLVPSQIKKIKYPNGDSSYVLSGRQTKRVGEIIKDPTKVESEMRLGKMFEQVPTEDGSVGYVQIIELPEENIILNERNSAAFKSQTGIDIWNLIKSVNNRRGTTVSEKKDALSSVPKSGGSTKKMTPEEMANEALRKAMGGK